MDFYFRWTNGLTFGLEQENVMLIDSEESDDFPEDMPEDASAVNIHLGFFRVVLMFY